MTYKIIGAGDQVLGEYDRFMEAKRAVDAMQADLDYLEVWGPVQLLVYDEAGRLVDLARPIL